jgi:beta-lactam-binding protein with PASTA domain
MGGITEDVHAEISVGGDVLGQIAVGNNIVQIREHHGNLVFQLQPDTKLNPTRRPLPAKSALHSPQKFFGRQAEISLIVGEANAGRAIAVDGQPGIGRSALLRKVAADERLLSAKYLSNSDLTPDDATQVLFDTFYSCDFPVRLTPEQAKPWLQEIQASIIIDDVEAAIAVRLVDLAPQCGFVLAATTSPVDGVRSVQLNGLGPDDARTLFESGLGRTLGLDEIGDADKLCILAENSPSRILQTAATARSSNQALSAFAEMAWSSGVLPGLPPTGDDLRLIELLAAIPSMVMPESWLVELVDLPDTVARLDQLVSGGLVKAVLDVGYRLVELRTPTDEARTAVVEHAVRFAQTHRPQMHDPDPTTEALKRVQADCTQRGNWQAVLDIGAALDPVYAQSGRWDAWRDVLAPMLTAARALGDRAAEARALHQLGTRELCLLAAGTAAGLLAVALRIRQMIGDSAGAAATQHNISLIPSITAPPTDHVQPTPRRGPRPKVAAAIAGTALMIVATTTVAVTLTSYTPAVSFDPTGLTFPAQPVSTPSSTFMVDLVNAGQATAHITAPRTAGPNATDFGVTATTCGAELSVGQHCSTTVAFTPLAEGKRTALLEVDIAEGGSGAQVALAGTGSPPTGVILDPTSLDFGDRIVATTSAAETLILTMPAAGAPPLGQLTVEGLDRADYTVVNNTCPSQGPSSGGSCVVGVQFTPRSVGPRDAHVQIIAADGSILAAAPLHGVGTPSSTGTVPAPAPGPTRVAVPDLVGKSVTSARQLLAAAGLKVGADRREPDKSVAADTVLRSQPGAGTKVDAGANVDISVSSGPPSCVVPDVVNKPVENALELIKSVCGSTGSPKEVPSDAVPKGAVISTNPSSGATITQGGTIQLVVSKGGVVVSESGVRVPNVVGKYPNDAKQALTNAGLTASLIDPKNYENLVSSTSPAVGTLVGPRSTVTLVFESAPPPPSTSTTVSPGHPISGG